MYTGKKYINGWLHFNTMLFIFYNFLIHKVFRSVEIPSFKDLLNCKITLKKKNKDDGKEL